MRPLAAALCLGSNDIVLTGEPRMKERPIGHLVMRCAWRGEDHLPGTRKLSAVAFTGRLYWRQR